MKRKLSFIIFLFSISYSFQAQILTALDKETKEPLAEVTIKDINSNIFVITNENGKADIGKFKNTTRFSVQTLGYRTSIKSYTELKKLNFIISLTPSIVRMDEVVISASRWKQKTSDLASKVEVISSREVALINPQTAADLLTVSGKVFVQKSQQGGGSPMIRGFATNRLLYTIDGVRMNNAIFRAGNIQNVISLDPFAIEKTEVFFGPGSVIYGSDAVGAVMSFNTLTPKLSTTKNLAFKGTVFSRYSSANKEQTYHTDFNFGLKKWAFLTSISLNDYGDLTMGSHGPEEYLRHFFVARRNNQDIVIANKNPKVQIPTGYSQKNIMQKIRFKPNNLWDFEYGFHFSETSSFSRYDRHLRTRGDTPRYGEWKYGPQKWLMHNLEIAKKIESAFADEMTIRMTYQYFGESRISRDFNQDNRETRTEEVAAYSTNIDFMKSLSTKSQLFYGTEYVYNDVTSTGINTNISTNTSQEGPSRYPNANWSSLGFYASNQYDISRKWIIQSGLRYNFYALNAAFDSAFYPFPFEKATIKDAALTGSLGLVFRPQEDWLFSTNFSTAFRSPNVDDVGKIFDSEPGSVVVPNPNLKAEYAYNTDISIVKKFGDYLKIEFTSFFTQLNNALVRRAFNLNGQTQIVYDGELSAVQAIQNAANANVYGFQMGFEAALGSGFGLSSNFNYQKGEEELDNGKTSPLRHASPWFGSTKLTFKASKLLAQLYGTYSGAVAFDAMPESEQAKAFMYAIDENGNPYSPSWFTVNLKTSYKINDTFLISSGIENITDQRYRPYSSGLVASGRNFVLSLKGTI